MAERSKVHLRLRGQARERKEYVLNGGMKKTAADLEGQP